MSLEGGFRHVPNFQTLNTFGWFDYMKYDRKSLVYGGQGYDDMHNYLGITAIFSMGAEFHAGGQYDVGAWLKSKFDSPCFIAGTLLQVLATEETPAFIANKEAASPGENIPLLGLPVTTKPIEQIRNGDKVVTRNPTTGQTEFKRVVSTKVSTTNTLLVVALSDKATGKVVETITTTPQHPFNVAGKGFTAAINLVLGNAIVTRAGPALIVQSITPQAHPEGVLVYNFEVEDDHTYFVGIAGGGAWVHNDCAARVGTPGPGVTEVPLNQIDRLHPVPRPGMPDNHIGNLASSIRKNSYDLGQAIPIARMPDGRLVSLGGHHRVEAMRQLGETTIPGRVVDWNSLSAGAKSWYLKRFPDAFR